MFLQTKERRGEYKFKNANGKSQLLKNSGYDDTGVIVKLDQKVGEDNRIGVNFEHINAEGGSPVRLFQMGNNRQS